MDKLVAIVEAANNINDKSLEEQVKIHFVLPLLNWLNIPEENQNFEFPVRSYAGTKHADIAIFSNSEAPFHVENTVENTTWISNHCLLVIETKRPEKLVGSSFQAKYYCDNLGAIAYLCTDCKSITGYIHKDGIADRQIIDCSVSELPDHVNELLNFRYESLLKVKQNLLKNNISDIFEITDFYPDGLNLCKPANYIHRVVKKTSDKWETCEGESLFNAIQHDKKILLFENAGAGKTYELLNIAHQLYTEGKMVPIYYSLKNYTGQDIETIEKTITKISKYPHSVLLLDGYDELEKQYVLTFPKKINDYVIGNNNRVIITARSNFIKPSADGKSTSFSGFNEYALFPVIVK